MREKIAQFIARRWYLIVGFWITATIVLRMIAPAWTSVIQDGDFQFLPANSPSRIGQATLKTAFPNDLGKSQMVVVFTNEANQIDPLDLCTQYDVARRLTAYVGDVHFKRIQKSHAAIDKSSIAVERLKHTLDTAIEFDELWFQSVRAAAGENASIASQRLLDAYRVRLELSKLIGDQDLASNDTRTIEALSNLSSQSAKHELLSLPSTLDDSIEDIWTWHDPVLGTNLGADQIHAKLLALQLREEFMAVKNIETMKAVQAVIDDCRKLSSSVQPSVRPNDNASRMKIHITGPAAVGADLLTAASESVVRSEAYAVLAVITTLILIYRSPILVFLPLMVIGVALSLSINILSIGASASAGMEVPWIEVYSTTRVFLVVLIFGIGTDLCLFLIVRCRETYFGNVDQNRSWKPLIADSWTSVFGAIAGSGLTTAIGLSMMGFSEFAKFRYSGIAIAISLIITLVVCLTLPAAVLAGMGAVSFWPRDASDRQTSASPSTANRIWTWLADLILARPGMILLLTMLLLSVPALFGLRNLERVTYDLVSELSDNATSRQGQAAIRKYLPRIETSSITLCVVANKDFADEAELREMIELYRKQLFVDGVHSVQALTDPLGEFPPDRAMSLFSQGAWRRRLLQGHPLTLQKFTSSVEQYHRKVARFDVVTSADPFGSEAEDVLNRVLQTASKITSDKSSKWFESTASVTGTTAGIVDLKRTTQADENRVQFLVALSVMFVLLLLTRRLELSIYLMATVLLSFFVTLGVSQALFMQLYGASYQGLDWKVTLFLFVILVAVGQDYNIYLTTRVIEEQAAQGKREGLRNAIVSTGGIITSCGLIMFATFAAMCIGGFQIAPQTSATGWPIPTLRGIGELGFALSFGVLLDTFVIRTILVPTYIAWRRL
jgi:putative drug exporter of the RND superfamily